jgi:L-threonylcarbamoyladenylate synthase
MPESQKQMRNRSKSTSVLRVDPRTPEESTIREAARLLKDGKLVAFPTDTLYGLGANATDPEAIEGVFSAKGRPKDKPLIVLARDLDMVGELVEDINPLARKLMNYFWPGPLTLIMIASAHLPLALTGHTGRIGVRVPDSIISQSLLKATSLPLTASSANRSGGKDPVDAQTVWEELAGTIDLVLDGGPVPGMASAILDLTLCPPRIIRPGPIPQHLLAEIAGGKAGP